MLRERIEGMKVFEKLKKSRSGSEEKKRKSISKVIDPEIPPVHIPVSPTMAGPTADIDLESAWEEALDIWGFNIWLSMPNFVDNAEVKELTSMNDLIAFTDLLTRQVTINKSAIEKFELQDSMTEIMAHEIGHHFRYPHTMQEVAALMVIQEKILPGIKAPMFINLFEDLLINQYIGTDPGKDIERRKKLSHLYRQALEMSAKDKISQKISLVFLFYLSIYEKMWNEKILTHASRDKLRTFSSGYLIEADEIAKDIWKKPNLYHKFIYFCYRFRKYLEEDAKNAAASGQIIYVLKGTCGKEYNPDTDDVNSVMTGAIADAIEDAIADINKGSINQPGDKLGKAQKQSQSAQQKDLDIINRLSNSRPGHDAAEFRKILVSKHYQRLVDQNILKIPATVKAMEKTIPSVLEDWDWGDSIKNIDWNGTIQTQGHMAGIKPQKRDLLVDDGAPEYYDVPAIEIYLDTSGSMPNPQQSINAMSLAAMILAASAIRHKGMVRTIIYSSGPMHVSEWMRDELKCNDFLLHYIGGGTDYPFEYLADSCKNDKNIVRVIISDSDFLYNLSGDVYAYGGRKQLPKTPRDMLWNAIGDSKVLVAMLHLDAAHGKQSFVKELSHEKFKLVTVQDLNAYAKAAGELAAALFDGYGR